MGTDMGDCLSLREKPVVVVRNGIQPLKFLQNHKTCQFLVNVVVPVGLITWLTVGLV